MKSREEQIADEVIKQLDVRENRKINNIRAPTLYNLTGTNEGNVQLVRKQDYDLLKISVDASDEIIESLHKRLRRYEEPGQKCNSGHINHFPISLWDCPMCTEALKDKANALGERSVKLLKILEDDNGNLRALLSAFVKNRAVIFTQEPFINTLIVLMNASEYLINNPPIIPPKEG